MDEQIKIWLADCYNRELDEVKVTISNTRGWLLASQTDEEAEMFTQNIVQLELYQQILEEHISMLEDGSKEE